MQRSMMSSRNSRLLDSSSSDEDGIAEDTKSNGSSGYDTEEDPTPITFRDVRDAETYLVGYETMVRQQEADDLATWTHLKPCITRLQELSGVSNAKTTLDTELSFAQLRKALHVLESKFSSSKQERIELLETDRQLMMILRVLTQKQSCEEDDTALTVAEFVQCYQIAIVGMLTLQKLPNPSAARNRARDRTISMLSLFEPPSTKIFNDFSMVWQDESVPTGYSGVRLLSGRRTKRIAVLLVLVAVAGFLIHGSVVGHGTILQTRQTPDEPTYKMQKSTLHSSFKASHFRPTTVVPVVNLRPSPVTTRAAHFTVQRRQSGVRSVVVGSFVAASVGRLFADTAGWMMLTVPPVMEFSLMAGVGVLLSVYVVSMKGTAAELLQAASPWTFGEYRVQLEM